MKKAILFAVLFTLACGGFSLSLAAPAEPKTILLWPGGAPGASGTGDADRPSLDIYPAPERLNARTAVVVCPGGGYQHLALDHEGKQVAEWLNSLGITALVLKYRLAPAYRHPSQMMDVQRALRYARANADSLSFRPDRIGVMGFSAGGHLASVSGTHILKANPASSDPLQQVSSRPDFMILVYPVISLATEFTHQGSKTNLLGENPDAKLVESMSSELQVTAETPPVFLVLGDNDKAVPAENSVMFYMALRQAGIPAELHIFQRGPHGFGLAPLDSTLSLWPHLCKNWLIENRFLY